MCERLRSRLFLQLPQGSMTLRFCPSKFTTHCPSRVHKDHSGSQFAASQVKLKGGGACETRVLPESPCSALVPRSPLTRPPRKTRGSSFRKGWAQRERRTCAIMPPPAVPAHHGDAPPPCRPQSPPTVATPRPVPPSDPAHRSASASHRPIRSTFFFRPLCVPQDPPPALRFCATTHMPLHPLLLLPVFPGSSLAPYSFALFGASCPLPYFLLLPSPTFPLAVPRTTPAHSTPPKPKQWSVLVCLHFLELYIKGNIN